MPKPKWKCQQCPGVNFINILRTAFTLADPKSAQNTVKPSVFFAPLGLACINDVRKIFVITLITPGNTEQGKCRLTNEYPFFLFKNGHWYVKNK